MLSRSVMFDFFGFSIIRCTMIRKSLDHEQLELLFDSSQVIRWESSSQSTKSLANYSTEPKILTIATGGGPPSRAFICPQ